MLWISKLIKKPLQPSHLDTEVSPTFSRLYLFTQNLIKLKPCKRISLYALCPNKALDRHAMHYILNVIGWGGQCWWWRRRWWCWLCILFNRSRLSPLRVGGLIGRHKEPIRVVQLNLTPPMSELGLADVYSMNYRVRPFVFLPKFEACVPYTKANATCTAK